MRSRLYTLKWVKLSAFSRFFFDDAVKRGLQAGHFDRFEQIVCGSQFKRAQGVFFVGCGEYNFRLAFGGTLNAFDKFRDRQFPGMPMSAKTMSTSWTLSHSNAGMAW